MKYLEYTPLKYEQSLSTGCVMITTEFLALFQIKLNLSLITLSQLISDLYNLSKVPNYLLQILEIVIELL